MLTLDCFFQSNVIKWELIIICNGFVVEAF